MGELKMMGIAVPEQYGGGDMDNVSYVLALIEISKACAGTGAIMSVNNSLYCFPVMTYGTHEQKMKYLYPVAAACEPLPSWMGMNGLSTGKKSSLPAAMWPHTRWSRR
jgi:alkylation response protein AidB-like acyl-CoA dehydrogenase